MYKFWPIKTSCSVHNAHGNGEDTVHSSLVTKSSNRGLLLQSSVSELSAGSVLWVSM